MKLYGVFTKRRHGQQLLSPREAWIEIPVNKKEYQSPQAATNKREDLSRADTLYTVSVADALIGGKDRKGRYYVKDVDFFAGSMDWND